MKNKTLLSILLALCLFLAGSVSLENKNTKLTVRPFVERDELYIRINGPPEHYFKLLCDVSSGPEHPSSDEWVTPGNEAYYENIKLDLSTHATLVAEGQLGGSGETVVSFGDIGSMDWDFYAFYFQAISAKDPYVKDVGTLQKSNVRQYERPQIRIAKDPNSSKLLIYIFGYWGNNHFMLFCDSEIANSYKSIPPYFQHGVYLNLTFEAKMINKGRITNSTVVVKFDIAGYNDGTEIFFEAILASDASFTEGVVTTSTYSYMCCEPTGCDPPIYQNNMAFPTREYHLGSDLNDDGDTDDTILRYQNLSTGEVVNTGLIASGAYHSMDIYENMIAFVGRDSHICYYDINTGTVGDTGTTGIDPSIHSNIIAFASKGTICYFDLSTQVLVNTKLSGHSPSIYQNLIVFCASSKRTIWVHDLSTGTTTDTGIIGWNPTLYGSVCAFTTSEDAAGQDLNDDGDTKDSVIRYYDFETQTITNTGIMGEYPVLQGDRIVFTVNEQDINKDLNEDGTILGRFIHYYDLNTGHVVNTRQLGTEPDIYEDTITFYVWERWIGQDLNGDGDQWDPIVDTYRIAVTEMSAVSPEPWLFLTLLLIGGITAYFKRKK